MLIEIAETHPAAPGKKVATVVAVGGARFDCWPEQLSSIRVGKRYEIETSDRVYNGRTYRKITKATPYGAADGAAAAPAAARTATATVPPANGYAGGNGAGKDRQIFVQGMLQAALRSGELKFEKTALYHATCMLMQLYKHTLGSEAGHRNHGDVEY
jgi:hypothetical protein